MEAALKSGARLALALVGTVLVTVTALAGGSRSEFQAFMDLASGGARHTVSFGGGGVPMATASTGGALAGNMGITHPAGGWPTFGGSTDLSSPIPGKTLPLTVKQPMSPASVGRALGNFAAKVAGPLVLGMAIYELLHELGVTGTWHPETGENTFTQSVATTGCVLPTGWGQPAPTGFGCFGIGGAYMVADLITRTNSNQCSVTYHCSDGSHAGSVSVWGDSNPTGTATFGLTQTQLEDLIAAQSGWPSGSPVDAALAAAVNAGATLTPSGPPTITSTTPTLTGTPKVTTGSDGSTKTETLTCDWIIPFAGTLEYRCSTSTVTATPARTETSTQVQTNPDGSTTTYVITKTTPGSTVTTATTGQEQPEKGSCGLPGTPACKIDETGTPQSAPELKLDEPAITTQANTNNTTITGTADKGFFSSWPSLFVTPPLVACEPIELPASVSGATINPCGIVDGMRSVVGWLWALAGFWLCLGWIREAV